MLIRQKNLRGGQPDKRRIRDILKQYSERIDDGLNSDLSVCIQQDA
jgi:hypothetical protein